MIKIEEIPDSIDRVTRDGSVYYNLRQLMVFLNLHWYGFPRMEKYKLRVIKVKNNLKGPDPIYVLSDDIKNIVYRNKKLVDKYLIGK